MSIVYVIHEPVKWNGNKMIKQVSLKPAEMFGSVKIIFPGTDRPPPPFEACAVLRKALSNFTADDYLVVLGDMDLVIWASLVAMLKVNGNLRLLKWNSRDRRYDLRVTPASLFN